MLAYMHAQVRHVLSIILNGFRGLESAQEQELMACAQATATEEHSTAARTSDVCIGGKAPTAC